jgi:polyisoprenoid-binding protein YceI
MKLFACMPLLAVMAIGTSASAADIDYARSEILFVTKQMNVPVQGHFKKFTAKIDFDSRKPASGKAEIEVVLASIDTGSPDADAEVGKKAWFNSSAFPIAKFASSSVAQTGTNKYEARGKLTIKGIAQDVVAPFTVTRAGNVASYEGSFTLKRLKFNIGEGDWSDTDTVADEVEVKFRIVTKDNK